MSVWRNTEAPLPNDCCRAGDKKFIQISVIGCVRGRVCMCVGSRACAFAYARVALLTQHAKRIRRVILLSVTCLAPSHFSTLSHKRHDFSCVRVCVVVVVVVVVVVFATSRKPHNWHYTYAVGFRSSGCPLRMVCEKPKHVWAYIVLIWFLIF